MVDPFSKKDWYGVKAPAVLNIRNNGKTVVTRIQGTKIASDGLKGHVIEVSLANLQNDDTVFRKFKLITKHVEGKNCLTSFRGVDLSSDKMCSMLTKWQTMTETLIDVKTADSYLLYLVLVLLKNTTIRYRRLLMLSSKRSSTSGRRYENHDAGGANKQLENSGQ